VLQTRLEPVLPKKVMSVMHPENLTVAKVLRYVSAAAAVSVVVAEVAVAAAAAVSRRIATATTHLESIRR
jgi:hypothetical protein